MDQQIGVSATALRNLLTRLEALVISYQQEQESQRPHLSHEIIASADETFFGEVMILILMDLSSGYLLIEDQATDRSYDTWQAKAQARLKALGLHVRHFVSDRAKALIKLATQSFNCAPGADLFHGQYELSKWLGASFYCRLGRAVKRLNNAQDAQAQEIEDQKGRLANLKIKWERTQSRSAQGADIAVLTAKLHRYPAVVGLSGVRR